MRRQYTGSKRPAVLPVEDDAPAPPEDRSEYLVSLTRLAAIIGRDRGTISDWVRKGMPVAKRAGAGETMLLDPKEVFAWRENFCREEEIARSGRTASEEPGGIAAIPLKPAELLKMEQLKQSKVKTGLMVELLIPRSVADSALEECLGIVRTSVMSIPERLVREMAGMR
jgi:phage terminase Nu1 subunit (DNA packaging protein)